MNRRQIAFGEPAQTLTRSVIEATYSGEIVVIEEGGSGSVSAILPPHHHDEF